MYTAATRKTLHGLAISLVPLLTLAWTTFTLGSSETPIEIGFADGDINIDADPSDWLGVRRHPVMLGLNGEERRRDGDLTVDAAFLFDAHYLYVLVEARDDEFQFPDRSWRYGDGFYLTLAEPTPAFRSNRYVTFGLSIEGQRLSSSVISRDGVGFPNVDTTAIRFAAVQKRNGQGIVYEAAIPWALAAPLQPVIDGEWSLNLIYVDGERGQRDVVFLHPDPDYDTESTDLRKTIPVEFKLTEITTPLVQLRSYRSHVRAGDPFTVALGTANVDPCEDGAVEWSVANGQEQNVDGGVLPYRIDSGLSRSRVQLQLGELPSGPVRISVRLKNDEDETLARAVFPVLVINVQELEGWHSVVHRFSRDERLPGKIRISMPSALFHLETTNAFVAHATPFEDASYVARSIDAVRQAISDLIAGRPVFANRRGVFRHAHRSAIDGTLQPYSVAIPERYDSKRRYPLLVMLHGSGVDERDVIQDAAALAGGQLDWIGMAPKARGLSDWYLGDSGRDVFECIQNVCKRYSIDSRCVVLMGFSSGGFGAWRLGLQRRELFAGVVILSAPLTARGESIVPLLTNIEGLPLFVVHGTADSSVSIEESRRAVKILRERKYPLLTYREVEGAGHGNYVSRIMPDLLEWLRAREGPD